MNILRINSLGLLKIVSLLSTTVFFSPQSHASNTSIPSQEITKAQCSTLKPTSRPKQHTINKENTQTNSQQAQSSIATTSDKTITIHANQVDYQPGNKLELVGDVEIIQGPYRATSNEAMINSKSNQAEFMGDIVLSGPDVTLNGDSATMDITTQQVSINNASFINPSTNLNGKALKIEQPNTDTLIIHNGLFSSCPPEDRDWAFASDKITLNKAEGFGEANSTRFLIKDVPVLYIPWFSFPIDDRRKTGFLYPTIGSSNTEHGLFLSTPYYLNLAPEYDATVTPTYIHGRGLHTELELRHITKSEDNFLILGYIPEDKDYRDEQRSLALAEDGERWGLNFKQKFEFKSFARGWYGDIEFNDISDNDYLDDAGQGLQIDRADHLDRRAKVNYSSDDWQFNILLQQYKSIDDQLLPNEEAYQRLPEMNFSLYQNMNALHLDWQSQYVYFYRDQTGLTGNDKTYGSRLRHQPKISLPLRKNWGFIEPSFTLDHTDYTLQAFEPKDNHLSRTVPIYEIDSGLYFDKPSSFISKDLRLSLEPRLYYAYSKAKDQDDIPNFDSALPSFYYDRLFSPNRFSGGDRIGDNNRLTLGFTTRWTDKHSGVDRAVFSLGQIYHYDDRSVNLNGAGQSTRSDSLFASELTFKPSHNIELSMTGLWDSKTRTTKEGNSSASFHSKDYTSVLNFSHRYIRDELEQSDTSIILPLYKTFSLIGRWRYDLESNSTIGTLAGVEYGSCCWRIQLLAQSYLTSDSEISNGLLFRFQLNSVGGFGKSTNSMDQQVPGYKAREEFFN
jgi:LPS-assembly protein